MKKTLKFISILFFLIACNNTGDSNLNQALESSVDCTGVYYVPPPTGPGTGVCQAKLIVINNNLIAEQICGGHDGFGHTETTETLFKTDFKSNFKYKVSDFSPAGTLGCDYFEIKDGKLILYDSELNIVRGWFCLYGRAEATQALSDEEKRELNECECIFLRASNEVSDSYLQSSTKEGSPKKQSREERIIEIKEWYSEIQSLGMINCDRKKRVKNDINLMNEEVPFEQSVSTCDLNDKYKLIRAEFSGYEWNDNITIYKRKDKIFFIFIEGIEGSSYWERRYYCDNDENVIKILKKEGDMSSELDEENEEISLDPKKMNIFEYIEDHLKNIDFVLSDNDGDDASE